MSKRDVLEQPIWLNSNIKKDDNVLIHNDAVHAGITHLKHIINENGEFYNYADLRQKAGNEIEFLEYYSICNCICIE